ncbi:hypothetical protein PF002_g7941 [Phytophthora fragariae]|uniref:Uncharacterized protein n=1 Tax=Phytophthora fragariae TaxID=53985 RepID=A0A6A3ZYT9_9STRA|nr:hypothetical protein PF002_g7941 [Phytophthora fragariae]
MLLSTGPHFAIMTVLMLPLRQRVLLRYLPPGILLQLLGLFGDTRILLKHTRHALREVPKRSLFIVRDCPPEAATSDVAADGTFDGVSVLSAHLDGTLGAGDSIATRKQCEQDEDEDVTHTGCELAGCG